MIEFNIAPNTQIGRVDIWNKWVVNYKGHTLYARDNGCAYDFPVTEIDNKKVPKKVKFFLDENCTKPAFANADGSAADVDYIPEEFKTVEYTKFYDNENIYHNPKYSRSGEFAENLVSDNIIEFCKRWLGLGGIKDILKDMVEYQQKYLKFYGTGEAYFGTYKFESMIGKLTECPVYDLGTDKKAEKVLIDVDERPVFKFGNMERSNIDVDAANKRVNTIYFRSN